MQFTTIVSIAFAATAYAVPVQDNANSTNQVLVSLPPGCTKSDLAKCALHLAGTTASCAAAVVEIGANPVADLSCVASAAKTAADISECKSCIPKHTEVVEN